MLCFSKFPVAKNFWIRRGGSIKILRRNFFCVAVPKNFIGEPFSVSFISGSKNFMLQRPMSRFSFEKFLSHSAGKFRREPFCAVFQKTSGSEKFSDKNGGGGSIRILRPTLFVSQCQKTS